MSAKPATENLPPLRRLEEPGAIFLGVLGQHAKDDPFIPTGTPWYRFGVRPHYAQGGRPSRVADRVLCFDLPVASIERGCAWLQRYFAGGYVTQIDVTSIEDLRERG